MVAVNYRQGPEFKHPAGSEDVAAVYKELLKTYPAQNIGIFGCSAGGMLTAMSVAWFDKHNIPMPGAVGLFCSGAGSPAGGLGAGDSVYVSAPLGGGGLAPALGSPGRPKNAYFAETDSMDPLVAPINSPAVLAKFPPTLVITATRAAELSAAVYTHSQLVKLGVDAQLNVWEHHSSGNYAILDQIAALRWIRQNIVRFGGDPERVTIFGHSAGASNVSSLIGSPLAKGLFHRAMSLSGNNLSNTTTLAEAEKGGVAIGGRLQAPSIAALRQKSTEEILGAAQGRWATNVDGWVFPQDVGSTIAAGEHNDVPLVVGTVAADVPGFGGPMTAEEARTYAANTFRELAGTYLRLYPSSTDAEATRSAIQFRSDSAMASARGWLRLQAKTGKFDAYWYYFTHVSPMPEGLMWAGRPAQDAGAYHGGEIVYVFDAFPLQAWPWRPVDMKLGEIASSIWVQFAKTGSPNGPALPDWPAFKPGAEVLMEFGDTPAAGRTRSKRNSISSTSGEHHKRPGERAAGVAHARWR